MPVMNPAEGAFEDDVGSSARAIVERRERLGKNLLSIGDAVIVTDALGSVILLNPAAESLTGWTDHDARDRPIETVFRIIHEVTRQSVIQPVKQVIEHGGIRNLAQSTLLIAKDGSERAIDDSASPISDERGDLDGVILIFRDTTKLRQQTRDLEDELRSGEVIIAAVQDSLLVLDVDLLVRSANRVFYEVFQTSQEATINRSFFDLGGGQWNVEGLRSLLYGLLSEETCSGEFQLDGEFASIGQRSMHVNARKLNGKKGREMKILVAIEDTTGRSRMAGSLAASELRFRRLFEAAKDGILILDAVTGAIDDANPYLMQMLGYSRSEILGKHLWDIGLFGDVEASQASFRELQEKGYVRYEDLPLQTKMGTHVEVEVVSNVYRVNERMIIQCNIRDITERKEADEQQRQTNEATEAAGRAKDRFLANLSHELRTPLTPVLATIAYLEMMPNLPMEEVRRQIDSIRRNVELEAQLIDDLLDVTRIGSGKLELHQEILDIHDAVRSSLEVCKSEIEAKKMRVSLELMADVHHVWADPGRIQQVFWNLIKNAVKFTPPGGLISLRTSDLDEGSMAIEVADTGLGIEPDALVRVFDAFEQGDQSVSRGHGGLGLGLSIAKMLVELHDGVLTVTSGGRFAGSVFRVELKTVSPLHDHVPRLDPPSAGSPRILLVDDNPETLRTLALVLQHSGFDVRTATSVESAMAALGVEEFKLLISDIGLTDGSGLQIMRHCREHSGPEGISFSGYATDYDVRASHEAGFAHHLAKPADLGRMISLAKLMVK